MGEEDSLAVENVRVISKAHMNGEKGKRKKRVLSEGKRGKKTPLGTLINRPVRERKPVARLVDAVDISREFRIEKGRGTALKNIPNVAYKFSQRRLAHDAIKLLHTIVYGKRGKERQFKSNLLRFSGFVWHENKEKHEQNVKEKLKRCGREKLLELCDLLDIQITRAASRKEVVVVKLLEFLLAPHATTSELIAEKNQSNKSKKRRRVDEIIASSSGISTLTSKRKNSESVSEKVTKKKKSTYEAEDSRELEDQDVVDAPEKAPVRYTKSMIIAAQKEKRKNPTDDELRAAVSQILKNIDFNMAKPNHIVKDLGKRLNKMIKDELMKLAAKAKHDEDEANNALQNKRQAQGAKP